LIYSLRPMEKVDLVQVNEIDREAFPSQWPPPNYRQELQNRLAHYIVLDDDTRFVENNVKKPPPGIFRRLSRVIPWLKSPARDDAPPPALRKYLVGFSGIWVMADEAHITNIAVRRQYQGRGLGELLLIATIDLARELKASTMTLEVRASNLVAQKLYSKYGFRHEGVRRSYYLDNREDAIIMSTEKLSSDSFQAHLQQLREALAGRLA
jgi:ribosomal-protein-alanine N-acetyltransferase